MAVSKTLERYDDLRVNQVSRNGSIRSLYCRRQSEDFTEERARLIRSFSSPQRVYRASSVQTRSLRYCAAINPKRSAVYRESSSIHWRYSYCRLLLLDGCLSVCA